MYIHKLLKEAKEKYQIKSVCKTIPKLQNKRNFVINNNNFCYNDYGIYNESGDYIYSFKFNVWADIINLDIENLHNRIHSINYF